MASARPPNVIRFNVCPHKNSPMTLTNAASGIEVLTTSMLRQLPRKNSTINDTSPAAINASRSTPFTAARTNTDWSKSTLSSMPSGAAALIDGSSSFI